MKIFKNAKYTKRNYESSNIVACVAPSLEAVKRVFPAMEWYDGDEDILAPLTQLYCQGDVRVFGYL